ncbi:MAG: SdpI family protein [Eubacteriales bacterium]
MMWKHCPKEVNGFVGYRTRRSMMNIETWKFANEYIGKLWWKIGLILLVPTIIVHVPFYRSDEDTIGIVCGVVLTIQVIIMIGTIFPTEKALKDTFNEDGSWKK